MDGRHVIASPSLRATIAADGAELDRFGMRAEGLGDAEADAALGLVLGPARPRDAR